MRERAWAWFSAAGARNRLEELDKTLAQGMGLGVDRGILWAHGVITQIECSSGRCEIAPGAASPQAGLDLPPPSCMRERANPRAHSGRMVSALACTRSSAALAGLLLLASCVARPPPPPPSPDEAAQCLATLAAHGTKDMPIWGNLFWQISGGHQSEVQQRVANLTKYIETLQKK